MSTFNNSIIVINIIKDLNILLKAMCKYIKCNYINVTIYLNTYY